MKRLQELIKEISNLTLEIEEKYPELYRYLDENPISIPSAEHPQVDSKVLSGYLESLKTMLKNYIKAEQERK